MSDQPTATTTTASIARSIAPQPSPEPHPAEEQQDCEIPSKKRKLIDAKTKMWEAEETFRRVQGSPHYNLFLSSQESADSSAAVRIYECCTLMHNVGPKYVAEGHGLPKGTVLESIRLDFANALITFHPFSDILRHVSYTAPMVFGVPSENWVLECHS